MRGIAMAILEIRQKRDETYAVVRRETDVTPDFVRIATFSVSTQAADAIMASAELRLAVLTVFQGPYETGQRPTERITLGHPEVDRDIDAIIDAALLCRRKM